MLLVQSEFAVRKHHSAIRTPTPKHIKFPRTPMHLRFVLFAIILGIAGSTSIAAKDTAIADATLATSNTLSMVTENGSGKRLLRGYDDDGDNIDEARGSKDALETARKTALKVYFPVWLAKGKTPGEVADFLKMIYPLVNDKNWKVIKSYGKAYRKIHKSQQ
ncbi:unnamed protein product [Phytophthora lilii]|uniref:RxLR effector protein n=1 Tax=Phytophthora lilii TaxID=2077276 RepID=A0A9W6WTU8_9STRA|nr:unnamed protein product [Phytophthora lilii]